MITEMAKVVGYESAITHLDVDRVYCPVGLGEQSQTAQEIAKELLRVLKASGGVRFVERSDDPAVDPGAISEDAG